MQKKVVWQTTDREPERFDEVTASGKNVKIKLAGP